MKSKADTDLVTAETQDIDSRLRGNDKAAACPRRLPAQLLRALHAEWRKLSPNLDERDLRLHWTNEQFGFGAKGVFITSWSQLTQGQAKFLLKKLRAALGISPLNDYIARAAVRLFGSDWNMALAERIGQRFHRGPEIQALEFWQKKALFEELVGRIARADVEAGFSPPCPPEGERYRAAVAARSEAVRMEIVRQKSPSPQSPTPNPEVTA